MKPDYLPLEILCGIAILFITALGFLLSRRVVIRRPPVFAPEPTSHHAPHGACKCYLCEQRRKSAITATCPICGKHDPEHPFIRHAISCSRDDCGERAT